MTKSDGALFLIKKNSVTVGGGRTTALSVNGAAVDVQDQGDAGVQTFLAGKVTGQAMEISFEGYEDGQVLRDVALGPASGRFLTDIVLDFPNGDSLECAWFLSSYQETGAHEDGQTFTATLQSNGSWTFNQAGA